MAFPVKQPNPQKSSRYIQTLWSISVIFLLLPTMISLAARLHWTFDLLTSFHVQYALGLLPIACLLLVKKHWVKGGILLVGLSYNLFLILPVYFPAVQSTTSGHSLRLMVTNVWSSNRQHEKLLHLIREESPDLVLALEVNDAWMRALRELTDEYPYQQNFARPDNFGIVLFSKYSFEESEILELGDRRLPSVFGKIVLKDGATVSLIGTHSLPPKGRAADFRNQQLSEVANFAANQSGHVVLCGDLNVTPWSPHWDNLLKQSKLKDSRQGFGIQPSWPAGNRLLRIPIDHVLVSDQIKVNNRRIGPRIGSDHLPVIVDLGIPAERKF